MDDGMAPAANAGSVVALNTELCYPQDLTR